MTITTDIDTFIARYNKDKKPELTKCCICMENCKSNIYTCYGNNNEFLYSENIGTSRKCITCNDSWICLDCVEGLFENTDYDCNDIECCLCRKEMTYSNMVVAKLNFNGWNFIHTKELFDIVKRNNPEIVNNEWLEDDSVWNLL